MSMPPGWNMICRDRGCSRTRRYGFYIHRKGTIKSYKTCGDGLWCTATSPCSACGGPYRTDSGCVPGMGFPCRTRETAGLWHCGICCCDDAIVTLRRRQRLASVCIATSESISKLPLTDGGHPLGFSSLGMLTVWDEDDRNQDITNMCIALAEYALNVKADTEMFKAIRFTCKSSKEIAPIVPNTRKDSEDFKRFCVWLAHSSV